MFGARSASARDDGVGQIVGEIYDTVASPDAWPAVLDRIAKELRSRAPALNLAGRDRDAGSLWIASGEDEEARRAYETYFISCDPRRAKIQETPAGGVFVGSRIFSDGLLVRTEFYDDFLRRFGFFQILGCVPVKERDRMAVVRFIRSRRAPRYDDRDVRLLATLTPHLGRALRLHDELSFLRADLHDARNALARLPQGIALLDRDGNVLLANDRARSMLERDLAVELRGERFLVKDERAKVEFDRMLEEVLVLRRESASIHRVTPSPGLTAEYGGSRTLSVRLELLPAASASYASRGAVAALFVDEVLPPSPASARVVSQALGLTEQQARIAVAVAAGASVRGAAARLGITYETARTHLTNIRARTGTHSQKDLIRVVLSLTATENR